MSDTERTRFVVQNFPAPNTFSSGAYQLECYLNEKYILREDIVSISSHVLPNGTIGMTLVHVLRPKQ